MNILYYDTVTSRCNTTIKSLCRSSDVISIHIDYNKKNHNFFDQKYLSLMKKSSFLVNTSRGEVVNHEHLLNFLKKKKLMELR